MAQVFYRPWTQPPPPGWPLNPAHPCAKGLRFLCPMNRPGNQVNLVDGRQGIKTVNGSAAINARPPEYIWSGPRAHANYQQIVQEFVLPSASSTDELYFDFGTGYDLRSEITMFARFRDDGLYHSGYSRIISQRTSAGGSDEYMLGMQDASTAISRIGESDYSLTLTGRVGANYLTDFYAATNTTSDPGIIRRAYDLVNGNRWSTTTAAGGSPGASTANLCIGGRYLEDRGFDGDIYLAAIWDRYIEEGAMDLFRRNPYAVFMPRMFARDPITITDVDTDETWTDGDSGLIITGDGFV